MDRHFYHNPHLNERRNNTYAVVIYLPLQLDKIIYPLRERFDPDYNLVDSHITLVLPFDSEKSLDEMAVMIKSELDAFAPFKIKMGSIADFYPEAPVIYWEMLKNEIIEELYKNLNKRLGIEIRHDYKPHVTIAREISNHRKIFVKDIIASCLSQETLYVEDVDLITPLSDRKWVSVRRFKLTDN
ncbi:MAG: hypothetical protein DRP35_02830 [Candidatus Zixiibacteriota bacterium]|nr:MAG: hypothetical protein DRP35_02830 [candidate division Zixibacteria bacterium]